DEMPGAPILAGRAALRTGSGLVQVAMPRAILAPGLSACPELIGLALDGSKSDRALIASAEKSDCIAIGPGLGTSTDARRRLLRLIALEKPIVIDADALNLLASEKVWPKKFNAHAILTPHPGEMKRLSKFLGVDSVPTDDTGRIELASRASKKFEQVVVLKGARTVVADFDGSIFVNQTGDSSLSKAGTGDVLTGIIASLIGQGMTLFDAVCLGTHLHGLAGELAGKKIGQRSVLAWDVIDAIPDALKSIEGSKTIRSPK
ncbi:MAG TPA: NAD(P)H-hydrate dehydratase, partial [Tepidisphaeraceae bacterium]|nr:NAD(P)H-hydrate dehydratase [Tepidisphaeraceae bacterium]